MRVCQPAGNGQGSNVGFQTAVLHGQLNKEVSLPFGQTSILMIKSPVYCCILFLTSGITAPAN